MTEKEKEPRLIITKIVVENFKSYAGKREIGPFHESFTCVVGPNGSGKSNVIDAIQFVFGKRGNKIRLKKLSELIHHSEKFPNLTQAKVSVHFNEVVDLPNDQYKYGKEFVVSRTVNDKSVSNYYIDEKKSTMTDVTDLLKSKGIDLDNNRFLILQGEVEQISLMKPKAQNEHEDGLLEYIEDIIGTNKYQKLISEAEIKVEKTNEERNEKLNRVKVAQKDKDALEGSKKEAEDYLDRKLKHYQSQAILFQLEEEKLKNRIVKIGEEKEGLKKEHEKEIKKMEEYTNKLKETEKVFKEHRSEYDKLQNEMLSVKNEWSSFERKHVKITQDLENFEKKEKTLDSDVNSTKKKLEQNKKIISKSDSDEKDAKEKLEKLKPDLEQAEYSVEKIQESIQSEIGPIRIKIESKQKELVPFKNQVNEIQQKIDIAEGELKLLNRSSDSLQKKLSESKDKIKQLKEEQTSKTKEIETLENTLSNITTRIPKLQKEIEEKTKEEENQQKELEKKSSNLEKAKSQANSQKSQNKVLSSIMKAKSDGSISGICDRLGNLGTIDKKYDIAISTACPSLHNIVVETTESGKECVNYLRNNNLGVATFLMIDKISKSPYADRLDSKFESPEGVPRLFDLIKPKDKKYRIVFYYALRDTLVANDLDQATRIAYGKDKRYRVVTLKGELIETSGVMSGGGTKILSGGMSAVLTSEVSAKDLEKMEKEVKEMTEKYLEVKEKKNNIISQLKQLEKSKEEVNMSISKTKMDLKSSESRIPDLEKRIKEIEVEISNTKKDEKKIKELNDLIENHQKELKKVEKNFKSIENEIEKLNQQINEAGGVKLKTFKEKVEKLNKEIDETNSKLTKIQVGKDSAIKIVPKLEKQLEKSENELSEVKEKVIQLEKEKKEMEKSAEDIYKTMMNCKKVLEDSAKVLEEKEEKQKQIQKKVDEMKLAEVEINQKFEDFEKEINESNKKLKFYSKKIETIEKESQEFNEFKENKLTTLRIPSEELSKYQKEKLEYEVTILETEVEKMKPNLNSIQEYRDKEKVYKSKNEELEKVTQLRNEAQKEYEELRKKRLEEFTKGFLIITTKLKEIYQMITLGGDAELELVDNLDPFSEGISFSVRPPKKSWKNITNLSGGEKTLSSLALVFALHHYKPTPIYVMDEIDAALDFRNVSIIANYIKERTKNCAQFIVISLRNNMFELGDRLVGIYKTDNVTKTVCIDPHSISNKMIKM